MALSLGVKKGSKIKIGDHDLLVLEVVSPTAISISVGVHEEHAQSMLVTDLERREIMPGVFVSAGKPGKGSGAHYARLAFEAPKAIRIERTPD